MQSYQNRNRRKIPIQILKIPSVPPPSHQCPIQSIRTIQSIHMSLTVNDQPASQCIKTWPLRPSRSNGGAPVLMPANIRPSHPLPNNVPYVPSVPF